MYLQTNLFYSARIHRLFSARNTGIVVILQQNFAREDAAGVQTKGVVPTDQSVACCVLT